MHKDAIEKLDMNLKAKDIETDLKEHFNDVEDILALNNPANIKLWLKERVYSVEVFDKCKVVIKYKLLL